MKDIIKEILALHDSIKSILASLFGAIICAYHNVESKEIKRFIDIILFFVRLFILIISASITGFFSFLFIIKTGYLSNELAIIISFFVSAFYLDLYKKIRLLINEYKFNQKDSN